MRKHHFDWFDTRQLTLDSTNKKIGGVCSGVARYLDVPGLYVRLATIAGLCLAGEAVLIAYGLAYVILDDEPDDEPFEDC